MAKHSKASSKTTKKIIAIASLAVILVVALGIIAYQVFYPHKTPDKSASFAQTSSTKVSKSTASKSKVVAHPVIQLKHRHRVHRHRLLQRLQQVHQVAKVQVLRRIGLT
ncbi:hypothetical protein ICE98_00468 [Lactococcus lactis]|nr:hypothetical protein [Lactococcus lactis]